MPSYTAAERKRLAAALEATGSRTGCPVCGEELSVAPIARPEAVSYVRRRVLVTCTGCRRQGAVDVSADARP